MSNQEVKKSEYAIVNEVAVLLNLGDFGKLESFIRKCVKTLGREIETAERSIDNAKHNFKTLKSKLDEKLEDAEQTVDECYTDLDPSDLNTNDAQRKFMETYFSKLDKCEATVLGIKEEIKLAQEGFDKDVKSLEEEIAVRKARIVRLKRGDSKSA